MIKAASKFVVAFILYSITFSANASEPFFINASDCTKSKTRNGASHKQISVEDWQSINSLEQTILLGFSEKTNIIHKENTLFLIGLIDDSATKRIATLLAENFNINTLVVTSGGGNSSSGMHLGRLIFDKKINLHVLGLCLSACANYLLSAASQSTIDGIVGFHGTMTGCLERHNRWERIFRFGIHGNIFLEAEAEKERKFFSKHDRLINLIHDSSSPTKGDPEGNSNDWLLATPKTLEQQNPKIKIGKIYASYEKLVRSSTLISRLLGSTYWK